MNKNNLQQLVSVTGPCYGLYIIEASLFEVSLFVNNIKKMRRYFYCNDREFTITSYIASVLNLK